MNSKVFAGRAVAAALVGIAAYYALLGGEYTAFDLLRLRKARATEASQLAAVKTEVDSLSALLERLEDDRGTIEAVARERFGMIREGEVLYRFVDVDTTGVEPDQAP